MPAHSSRNADSFGVIIVLAFLGGCWSLVGGAVDARFADGVGRAAERAWPFVLTTLVLWAIATVHHVLLARNMPTTVDIGPEQVRRPHASATR